MSATIACLKIIMFTVLIGLIRSAFGNLSRHPHSLIELYLLPNTTFSNLRDRITIPATLVAKAKVSSQDSPRFSDEKKKKKAAAWPNLDNAIDRYVGDSAGNVDVNSDGSNERFIRHKKIAFVSCYCCLALADLQCCQRCGLQAYYGK